MFTTTERRGPHKSMHCKFCKPPGTIHFADIPAPPMLQTKTNLHLCHETADLKIYDIYDEPGFIDEESNVCICQLEGDQTCLKCAPDKSLKPVKKKVCDCPVGAKPHPNMASLAVSKKKKKKEKKNDDEFWWEKYDREHDARVKEMWAAYMAQRKLDKKLAKQKEKNLILSGFSKPPWFHKLSCQQKTYLEYLSTAIRLDLDESITDRTSFVLKGIGFHPRATKKMLEKCLRYCRYNAVRFLNQLWLFYLEEDPYKERLLPKFAKNKVAYSWNDRIIMACICHLEFPELLREIMDRLPLLPQEQLPPYIPKLKIKKRTKKKYESPYDEPVWIEQIDWSEQRRIDKKNDYREHLSRRRVKIPDLALVRRPSLIDARPLFLSQIEESQSYHRRRKNVKKKIFPFRKKKKATFDSKVDITAIAGIEASEISTTPKADPDEICIFLRDRPSETDFIPEEEEGDFEIEGEEEEEEKQQEIQVEPIMEPKVKFEEGTSVKSGSSAPLKTFDDNSDVVDDELDEDDEIPFVTPPKTHSGRTIEEPCPPPKGSPGPPAAHYDEARREVGLINEELCIFNPNDVKSDDEEKEDIQSVNDIDIESQLKQVAKKLKELHLGDEEEVEEEEEIPKIPKKKRRKKKKVIKKEKDETNKKTKPEKRKKLKKKIKKPKKSEEFIFLDDQMEEESEMKMEEESQMKIEEESSESCLCKEKIIEEVKVKKNKEKSPVEEKVKKGKKKNRKERSKKLKKSKKKKVIEQEIFDPCRVPEKPIKIEKKATEHNLLISDLEKENEPLAELAEMDDKNSLEESCDKKDEEEDQGENVFEGEVLPLLEVILKDLNEEGFISAGFDDVCSHPDIVQLMKYLHGEILTKARKDFLKSDIKKVLLFLDKKKTPKVPVPILNISKKRLGKLTWNDKNWLENLAAKKKDIYFFQIARCRNAQARDLYLSLHQEYFGTERFLNSFYAYMIAARHESIMKGLT